MNILNIVSGRRVVNFSGSREFYLRDQCTDMVYIAISAISMYPVFQPITTKEASNTPSTMKIRQGFDDLGTVYRAG